MAFPLSHTAPKLEVQRLFTALGIRFWDPVLSRPVRNALRVQAWEEQRVGAAREAYCTASGLYAFRQLPGLEAVELPPEEETQGPVRRRGYVVEVEDTAERYLPFAFRVRLPLPGRGPFPQARSDSLPEAEPPGVFLFSATTRTATGLGAVRTEIHDVHGQRSAANAVLEVRYTHPATGRVSLWQSFTDARGRALVVLPYPAVQSDPGASLPPGGPALTSQHWPVTVRVRYQPARQQALPRTDYPDLSSTFAQGYAHIFVQPPGSTPHTPSDVLDASLPYGRAAVLKTEGHSTLLIEPALESGP